MSEPISILSISEHPIGRLILASARIVIDSRENNMLAINDSLLRMGYAIHGLPGHCIGGTAGQWAPLVGADESFHNQLVDVGKLTRRLADARWVSGIGWSRQLVVPRLIFEDQPNKDACVIFDAPPFLL